MKSIEHSGDTSGIETSELIKQGGMDILKAIDRVQAIIEFDMDGVILSANDNFLDVMGYTLDEITGRHHSIFVEPGYEKSAEYRNFWTTLNRGEFQTAEYKRVGKGGKEVWIQASYNPILGDDGKPYAVVKFAIDTTEQKLAYANFSGQMEAIRKSQAVIEFDMGGTILSANDNFLSAMGYTLDEIQGRHHSIFVEPDYKHSAEYKDFWATLNRGEYQAAEYKRIGKGGRDIWIQASYNPILDLNGKPYKVVKYATDITIQKELQLSVATVLEEVTHVMSGLGQGDLSCIMAGEYEGDFALLSESINGFINTLRNMVIQITESAINISTSASEISQGNTDLSHRTEEQASSLEETASTMEQMTAAVKSNADNARHANHLASGAREHAERGGEVVAQAIQAMSAINASSKQIVDIIGVIDEIAFQTNLLALNASVEAARAGEQGRGFAVVAAEVRNLAQRSAQAAKEIKSLINDSAKKVDDGSRLVEDSGKTLEEIVTSVKKVSDINAEIAAASLEQSAGIEQVNKAITQLDEVTQQNAALVEQAAASSESMNEQANTLRELVEYFNMGDNDEKPVSRLPCNQAEGKPSVVAVATGRKKASSPLAKNTIPTQAQRMVVEVSDGWEEF